MKNFLLKISFSLLTLGVAPLMAQNNSFNPSSVHNQPGQATKIQWYTNYNKAIEDAQNKHLPLLLFFTGSDWCGWCKKMNQEIFSSSDFAQAVGNAFIFVEIDFPSKALPPELSQQNAQLKQKYGVTGYPTVIILDSNQNFIAETGYRPGGGKAFADYLKKFLQTS